MPSTSSHHEKAPTTKGAWLQGWTGAPNLDESNPSGAGLPWPSTPLSSPSSHPSSDAPHLQSSFPTLPWEPSSQSPDQSLKGHLLGQF